MNIDSPRFGTLHIEPSKIIDFPLGLLGFETSKRFTLFHPEELNPNFFILQSLDDVDVALKIIDPARLGFSYEVKLSDEEVELLKLADPLDAAVAVIIWKERTDADSAPLSANLNAPIVINTRERRGLQHVFMKLNCTISGAGE